MSDDMQKRLEEYENQVNKEINDLRRQNAAELTGEDLEWNNHPKVKELAMRLAVAREQHAKTAGVRSAGRGTMRASAPLDEAAPGRAEASPGLGAATRPDVLSSPYAGSEPRYARQYMNVPGGEIRPDPIERVKPDPESEAAGAVSPEEADYMPDGPAAVLGDVGGGGKPDAPLRAPQTRAMPPSSRDDDKDKPRR